MNTEGRPTTGHRSPTRVMILAWADTHSVDISNAEADDLVRRLWHPPTPFDTEAVEKCVVDALLLLAEGEEHDDFTAESLRRLASQVSAAMLTLKRMPDGEQEPDPSSGITERVEAEDDGVPGSSVGEADGTALRFDAVFLKPVIVALNGNGKKAKAIWPPSFGMVKLKPDGSRRSVVVALDDLDDDNRLILRAAPTRRRTEAVVRCGVRNCNQSFRAWIRQSDSGIETTKGEPINDEFGTLFAARCGRHRLTM